MTTLHGSTQEQQAITALALDGSTSLIDALSELYILQEAASRRAFSLDSELLGEDIRPCDMFDIIGGTGIGGFYAVLFSSLKMTIGQAIQSHLFLEERLFRSDAWSRKVQQPCVEILNASLDELMKATKIETSLDSPFEEKQPKTKCFVCVINTIAAANCRLIRNYRPRKGQNPQSSIRQVLHATLSNQVQLPTVLIQGERFLSALDGNANPTPILVKELRNGFTRGTQVACLVNVGAGHPGAQVQTNSKRAEEMAGLLRFCQLVAEDVAAQCHDLGPFFFRLSPPPRPENETDLLEDDISNIKGWTIAYFSTDEISARLDDLEKTVRERSGVVSIERLNSVAGEDGESRIAARLARIEQHFDDTIFRDVNKWLKPIHQTSKLDANIQARSGTTCRWLLENPIFRRWMLAKRGLFWFHGLMGTGKTVMSSFIIETLRARDDIFVAYYYFEFTDPNTLSQESLFCSLFVQLAVASPSLARSFYQKHKNGGFRPQLPALEITLNDLVSASSKPVFIVIDALDELPVAQRKRLLESLVAFCRLGSAPRIHIMMTSRDEVDIQRDLEGVDFELGVQGDLVRQDIAAFVDRQLEAKKWIRWPRDDVEMMRRVLNERADGQFRMVACLVDILQRVKSSGQLRESLYSLPKSLAETYSYILERIPEELRVQAHRLLAILSFASKTISTNELSALLAVDFGNEENGDDVPVFRQEYRFGDPLDVIDLGTSLVSRVESKFEGTHLQLAHASVKEYLLGSCWHWFSLDEDLAHGMIARSCLTLLSYFKILQRTWSRFEPYRYSRDHWYNHVLPNGRMQLLRQQQLLYTSFPWPYLSSYNPYPYLKANSPVVSAASFGLFNLLKAFLNAYVWGSDILTGALVEASRSRQRRSIALQCCALLIGRNANVNTLANNSFPLQAASSRGHLEIVQFFVDLGADVNATGGEYGTALKAAASNRNTETVQFLIETGADVDAVAGDGQTALQVAVLQGDLEIARLLVENGADLNLVGGRFGTAVRNAASQGDLETVRFLVEKGADVNAAGEWDLTALKAATAHGYLEIVQFLVDKGVDVNAALGTGRTALKIAVNHGYLDIVRLLVEKGADPNVTEEKDGTALHVAIAKGYLNIARLLVERGANVNAVGGKDGTALKAAIAEGYLDIVRLLVQKGADVNAVGEKDGTALKTAIAKGHLDIARLLVQKGADVNAAETNGVTALHTAARYAYLGIVQLLVEKGADVNADGRKCGTVLRSAASGGDLGIVQLLVEKGADVNADGGKEENALKAAAAEGYLEIVRFLVEKGTDVNAVGQYGTALHAATTRGCLEIVRLLIEEGADVNASGGVYWRYGTALHIAARDGNLRIAQLLVEKGADVNAPGEMGDTALCVAAAHGCPEVVRFLVEKVTDVAAAERSGITALHNAARCGSLEIVQFLIEKGVDVNAIRGVNETALRAAINEGYLEIVQFLVEKGASMDAVEEGGSTALRIAVRCGSLKIVQFLVEKGADVNEVGGHGETALSMAVRDEKLDIARFLVDKGACVDVTVDFHEGTWLLNPEENSPSRSFSVVEYLAAQGAKRPFKSLYFEYLKL